MKYKIRNRESKEIIYKSYPKSLIFLYNNFIGRIVLKLFTSKCFAILVSKYMNSKVSIHKINKFINKNKIDISEYEAKKYISFNDFFTRKIKDCKREINKSKNIFISPCDSKVSVYKINNDLTLNIKNSFYTIDSLVCKDIINEYINGYALVFRLDVDDYHRYCYIDNGYHEKNICIKGIFHTVQPISLKRYNFYKTNSREYTILHTDNFDDVVQIEIGAMCVGKIHNNYENYKFKKGEEKGYFEFGGSTIVLLIKDNILDIDKDIIDNSLNNIETIIKYGRRIGKKII